MNSSRQAGYNDLTNNDALSPTLYLNNAQMPDLENGYNNLWINSSCDHNGSTCTACENIFNGSFYSYAQTWATTLVPKQAWTIHADNNQWSSTFSSVPISGSDGHFSVLSMAPKQTNYDQVDVEDDAPVQFPTTCGYYDGNPCGGNPSSCRYSPLVECSDCERIRVSSGDTMNLADAVKLGMSYLDTSVARYADALDLFNDILSYNYADTNENEAYLLKIAYLYMSQAYSQAIEEKQITLDSPYTSLPEEAQKMTNVIYDRVAKAIADTDYYERYYGNLDMAESYRQAEMRDAALSVYDAMTFVNSNDQQNVDRWKCFVGAEKAMLAREITPEQFDSIVEGCSPGGSSSARLQLVPVIKKTVEKNAEKYSLFPNPTDGSITLSVLDNDSSQKTVVLTDILGNEVYRLENNSDKTLNIDLSNNPKGIYFVRIIQNGGSCLRKIVLI